MNDSFLQLISIASSIIILTYLFFKSLKLSNKKSLPQPQGKLPILGHLHLLLGSKPTHLIFSEMADKYGPIFTIKLGSKQTIIINNGNAAKECLTSDNDKIFAGRPKSLAGEILGYDHAMFGLSPDGPYWRKYRKLAVLQFLGNGRHHLLERVRECELDASLNDLFQFCLNNKKNCLKEMKEWFGNLALNMIVHILFGKRYSYDDKESAKAFNIMKEFMEIFGIFMISDSLPFLRRFDFGGQINYMKKLAKEIDDLLQFWLEEHKNKKKLDHGLKVQEQDFMDLMISALETAIVDDPSGPDADTINLATCLSLLTGATDTATVTWTWALTLLLNHPQEMKKVMAELDEKVGKERRVQESDMKKLVYLDSVIKETWRLYPPAPLGFPHESIDECFVAGYKIPKGTRMFVNIHKIQRDPNVWSNPNEFQPERFLIGKNIDAKGKNFGLIPFSSGRRMCPGMPYALNVIPYVLANLLQCFEFLKPSDEPIDMTESLGLTSFKATPLEVILSPRLSPHLYE